MVDFAVAGVAMVGAAVADAAVDAAVDAAADVDFDADADAGFHAGTAVVVRVAFVVMIEASVVVTVAEVVCFSKADLEE